MIASRRGAYWPPYIMNPARVDFKNSASPSLLHIYPNTHTRTPQRCRNLLSAIAVSLRIKLVNQMCISPLPPSTSPTLFLSLPRCFRSRRHFNSELEAKGEKCSFQRVAGRGGGEVTKRENELHTQHLTYRNNHHVEATKVMMIARQGSWD